MRRALRVLLASLLCGCPGAQPAAPSDAGIDAADAADGDAPPAWAPVVQGLDGALLSIWGTSATDIYAVGGPLGNAGFASLALHFDGRAWKRLAPGGTETFWWVHGSGARDVWMVGERGRITHFDGAAFTETPSGTTATLYGVWAASPTDAWAVGGTPEGGTSKPNDIVLAWDGARWSAVALPQLLGRTLFKVWGTSSTDLYAVGEAGTVWHRVGATWTLESSPPIARGTLFTVFGCSATEVYAVGGRDVLRSDGRTWSRVDVALTNDLNGVSCGKPGEVVIVGFGGSKQRLVAGAWLDDFGTKPYADLHGAWVDPTGALWAVGGGFVAPSAPNVRRNGTIARYGRGVVPGAVE